MKILVFIFGILLLGGMVTTINSARQVMELKNKYKPLSPAPTTIQNNKPEEIKANSQLKTPTDINTPIKSQIALTTNNLTKYLITPGETTTFNASINNFTYNQQKTFLVDIEIYDNNGKQVGQKVWDKVTLKPFESRDFSMTSSNNLPSGVYFLYVGIYEPGGSKILSWFPRHQNFVVE